MGPACPPARGGSEVGNGRSDHADARAWGPHMVVVQVYDGHIRAQGQDGDVGEAGTADGEAEDDVQVVLARLALDALLREL